MHKLNILRLLKEYESWQPFYCWQCVSLKLKNRTVDFVIEDEEALFSFINAV